jgi:hypothetical protein
VGSQAVCATPSFDKTPNGAFLSNSVNVHENHVTFAFPEKAVRNPAAATAGFGAIQGRSDATKRM